MRYLLAICGLFFVLGFAPNALAGPCQHDTDACVTSFSVFPGAIPGDQFTETVATGQIHIPQSANGVPIALELRVDGSLYVTKVYCGSGTDGMPPETGGTLACGNRNLTGDVTVQIMLAGLNGGPGIQTGLIHAIVQGFPSETSPTAPLEIDPVPTFTETPDQDPDTRCPDGNCGFGGKPINFTNGNTWIPQQDYSIPGLGGGLNLTRTWNSLWSRKQPPETVGSVWR